MYVGHQKLYGIMVESNHSAPFLLIKKAVGMNIKAAKGELTLYHNKGVGCRRDERKAIVLYREAFDAGSFGDLIDFAACYEAGVGVEKNHEKATKLYEECMSRSK